jgi:hypothetical protein
MARKTMKTLPPMKLEDAELESVAGAYAPPSFSFDWKSVSIGQSASNVATAASLLNNGSTSQTQTQVAGNSANVAIL